MKKLFVAALAALFVFGLIAQVAAEDRLSLSGSMRVRYWSQENYGDFDDSTAGDELDFFDQRFRLGAKITIAEGVYGHLRFDFGEDYWGSPNWSGVRYGEASELQVDRAYLEVDKEFYNLKAGQMLIGLGNYIMYDNQTTGIALTLKLPVTITLGYTKETENGSKTDRDYIGTVDGPPFSLDTTTGEIVGTPTAAAMSTEDVDTYLANIGYSTDMFSLNVFYAMVNDSTPADAEPWGFGVHGTGNFGMFGFNAELDTFGGDNAAGTDYVGTQFWADINAKLSDMIKLGVDLIYSTGTDDPTEAKIVRVNEPAFGDWYIADRGPFNTDIAPFYSDAGNIMEPFGQGTGAIAAGIYAEIMPMEGLNITGQFLYVAPEEDGAAWQYFDKAWVFNIGAEYEFAKNTAIAAQYNYLAPSWDDAKAAAWEGGPVADDAAQTFVGRLQVKF